MSRDTSQTQSTSTLLSFLNLLDKLKFKKKNKYKKSELFENSNETCVINTSNDNSAHDENNNNNNNGENVLKDMLITKIENYADIEKLIANNNLKEEGQIVSETIPNKTFEKDNKMSDTECIVLHHKKHKAKKKEKIENKETSKKEEEVSKPIENNETLEQEPALNSCGEDTANINLSRDCNEDVNTEKSEMKKHKKNKQLKCEYIVENCNIVELNNDMINQLKALPLTFNEKQLLFLEGKHIKQTEYNRVINKRSSNLKQKKCKVNYLEKPHNNKCTNSQSKFLKAIVNESTNVNVTKSLIITDSGAENQKTQLQELSAFSVDNVHPIREKVRSKEKKRRKMLNTYRELTKPKSNLIIIENNIDDENILKSNMNALASETAEEKNKKETTYLDSVPVRDSKENSIDQCNVQSEKDSCAVPNSDINIHTFSENGFHSIHPEGERSLRKNCYSKCDAYADKVTHERRACPRKGRFTESAERKTIDIEVNFDDKPNEHYNFLIESKNCDFSTKHVPNNKDFSHEVVKDK